MTGRPGARGANAPVHSRSRPAADTRRAGQIAATALGAVVAVAAAALFLARLGAGRVRRPDAPAPRTTPPRQPMNNHHEQTTPKEQTRNRHRSG